MTIKHILVPVDFSPCSINALRIASGLVKSWGSRLYIYHATIIPEAYMTVAGTYTPIDMGPIQEEVNESFERLKMQVPELEEIEVEHVETTLNLVDGLFTEILSKHIDLIIMGTRDHHDRLERLLGTHASEIIESANIPVLVIPESIKNLNPKKIGFATDARSISNISRLSYISRLAENYDASIDVFYIAKTDESLDFHSSPGSKVMERYFQGLRYTVHSVESDQLNAGIQSYLNNHHIDLIVMIPRHHGPIHRLLHGSTTRYMAQHLAIPLLSLPE